MMAPDYSHWHGMYEVADRFYNKFIPEALELCDRASLAGNAAAGDAARAVIADILQRPEHQWNGVLAGRASGGKK